MQYKLIAAAVFAAAVTLPALAAPIASIVAPEGVVDFAAYDGFVTSGPETVALGVTFGASVDSTLGAFIAELEANGTWGADKVFAALGSFGALPEAGSMSFTFDAPVAQVGAFINAFFPFAPPAPAAIEIAVLDELGTVLESHIVPVFTPGGFNEGAFAGIARSAAEIKTFRVSGFGVVLDDVSFKTSVPAPGVAALLIAALIGAGAMRRRSAG